MKCVACSIRFAIGISITTNLKHRLCRNNNDYSFVFQKNGMSTPQRDVQPQQQQPAGATPSPVREVLRFERDAALAQRLQQEEADAQRAAELDEELRLEDEFDAATRRVHDDASARLIQQMRPDVGVAA